ncbi:MAG TPA: YpdA family putative bacillithiol disulfide reductase, partial [Gemmatimonadales bacterium]|nr:YpdA family putative bacillithiol disulfide reductase [Gemmatimonadales bacterium]
MIPLLVVGAGPCGLAVGIAARRAGVPCVLLDRRTIVSTIERYPLNMTFFSTPERIEIGGVPLTTVNDKPTRRDGLVYYRRVADHFGLDVRPGEEVVDIRRLAEHFAVEVATRTGRTEYRAGAVVLATGYYDWPNRLGVPGEDLPHVTHYFTEGHHHWRQRVVVIGAGNSAVDAALECWRAGAQVALVHFLEGFDRAVKPWVLPDIVNRVKDGSIAAHWNSRVVAITPEAVEIRAEATGAVTCLPADAVLAMTGYHADTALLARLGVPVDPASGIPAHDEATMATPVPGCYIAGVIASG